MSDPQPMADDAPQAGEDLGVAPVEFARSDCRGEAVLVAEAELGQGGARRGRGLVEQFPFDDAQRVGGHQGVEVHRAGGRGPDLALQKLCHRRDEFGRGGTAVEIGHGFPSSSCSRSRMSHSVSQTLRPIAASSTDRTCPDR